jgi:hypothetical protein
MALISLYSADNKVVRNVRSDNVTRKLIWLRNYGWAWNVETVKREAYEYIGMTYAAAIDCQGHMVTEWTKTMTDCYIDQAGAIQTTTSNRLVADIAVEHTGGLMWKVTVDVNWVASTIEAMVYEE